MRPDIRRTIMEIVIETSRTSKQYSLVDGAEKPKLLPRQAQYVFYAMEKLGTFATPEEIGKVAVELGMKTRQPASRIVQYYLPTLNKKGVIIKS